MTSVQQKLASLTGRCLIFSLHTGDMARLWRRDEANQQTDSSSLCCYTFTIQTPIARVTRFKYNNNIMKPTIVCYREFVCWVQQSFASFRSGQSSWFPCVINWLFSTLPEDNRLQQSPQPLAPRFLRILFFITNAPWSLSLWSFVIYQTLLSTKRLIFISNDANTKYRCENTM